MIGDAVHAELHGTRRLVAGRLRYANPPEPGTILGPRDITRDYLVVIGQDDAGLTLLGYATVDDLAAAAARTREGLPARSVAEQPQPLRRRRVAPGPATDAERAIRLLQPEAALPSPQAGAR